MLDRGVAAKQPTKAVMKRRMREVSDAAIFLGNALGDVATRAFLESAGAIRFAALGSLQGALKNIGERAKIAAESPAITALTGTAKRGRGTALPPGAYTSKTFCAVIVAEAWKFLHGKYPAPRNRKAAEAAQAFWLICGGTLGGWGDDPLGAWRPYFKKAMGPETAKERAECLRRLELHKQHN